MLYIELSDLTTLSPLLPFRTKKKPKYQGKEKNPTTMAGNTMGRKKWHQLLSPEKKKKTTKCSCSSSGKQMGSWSISDVGPLFTARWICCPFFCWLGFSEVWSQKAATPCLPAGPSRFLSSQLFSLISDQIQTIQFTLKKMLLKDCS